MLHVSAPGPLQLSLDDALADVPRTIVHSEVQTMPVAEHFSRPAVIRRLQQNQPMRDRWPHQLPRAHIGIAGFFNFEMMGTTKPDVAILLDNNDNQRQFWRACIELLKACETGAEFRKRFFAELSDDNFISFTGPEGRRQSVRIDNSRNQIRTLRNPSATDLELSKGLGWTQDDAMYQHIRTMARNDRILCASMDLVSDAQTVSALQHWLDKNEILPGIVPETI